MGKVSYHRKNFVSRQSRISLGLFIMKFLKILLSCLFFTGFSLAQSAPEVLQFKNRIIFNDAKEIVVAQRFFDNESEIVFVGVKTIQYWDLRTGKLIKSQPHQIPNLDKFDATLIFSPDASQVIAIDSFGWRLIRKEKKVSASVFDLQSGKLITTLERPNESIRDAEWSENGETLVTYSGIFNSKRTEVCFWNGNDLQFRGAILLKGNVEYKKLLRDGKVFLAKTDSIDSRQFQYGAKDYLMAWDTTSLQTIQNFSLYGGWQGVGLGGVLTKNEKYVVMVSGDSASQRVPVWQVGGGKFPIYEIFSQKKNGFVDLLGITDNYFFTYQNKVIEMRDLTDGKIILSIPNKKRLSSNFRSFRLSPDEKTLVIDDCEKAEFFDIPGGQKKFEIDLVCKTDFDYVSTSYRDFDVLRFQPDGSLLLTASDKTIRLWNMENGQLLQTLAAPDRVENKKDTNKDDGLGTWVGWLQNGKIVFASGADRKSVLLWEF